MQQKSKKSLFNKFLDFVEIGGNKLPHPVTLFVILSILIIVISELCVRAGVNVTYTGFNTKTKVVEEVHLTAKSLFNAEGLRFIFDTMTPNFTSFAPLGTVLVAMIGVGVAEGTGLIQTVLKKLVMSTPKKLLTAVIIFAGIMSHIASDAGYVVIIPLGAIIFLSVGRHPIAGLAAAFAGVSGGFAANLLIGTIDPLLGGISTESAKIFSPDYFVAPTANWYFLIASTFLITFLGTIITEKVVEPRLGEYQGTHEVEEVQELTDLEKKGLRWSGISVILFLVLMGYLTIPADAVFKVDGNLNKFMQNGFLIAIMLFFMIPGIVYGVVTKSVKNDKDIAGLMGNSLGTLGGYLVLSFAAAQFIVYFSYTNLGTIIAVKGADFLQATGFTGFPLIIGFILVTAFINLFMGSASAKWAIMAPVFVPMFMKLGFTPEFTQVMFRIGDSTTNIISPLMSYFAFIAAYSQKFGKENGIGTLISTMLPYTVTFLIFWTALLVIWYFAGLPIGPEVYATMPVL